jgi:hypothetical protein
MKAKELIATLQKLIAENPKAVNGSIAIEWESDSGRTLERNLCKARFRLTNGRTPEIVLTT